MGNKRNPAPLALLVLLAALPFSVNLSYAQTPGTPQQSDSSTSQQTTAAPTTSPPSAAPPPANPLIQSGEKCERSYYPAVKVRMSGEGTTIVNVTVGTDGSVKNVTVAQSSGNQGLDDTAVSCIVSHWHFTPAMQNGQPVEFTKKYAIKWQMQNPPATPAPAPNPQ